MNHQDEPTQEQVKEFWEKCGFKFSEHIYGCWYPDDKLCHSKQPPIDLNNLFKYAEKPLVDHFIETTSTEEEYRQAYYDFLCKWLADYIWNEPHDPALALFWAIWEVIHGQKD